MRFNILGIDESYGNHRFSNNEILNQISLVSEPSDELNFVWWIEKIFIDQKYTQYVEQLFKKPWFGVIHVPLLTPNWAMYSQNDLSQIYLSESWIKAKSNCVGVICLSTHLAEQFKAFCPGIPVYSLKHPVGTHTASFDFSLFKKSQRMALVGAWLRNYADFCRLDSPYEKHILHNSYSRQFIKDQYAKYCPTIHSLIAEVKTINFLTNDEYDDLMCSSLIFLGLHETSANNAICECISYSTPFVSLKHPAVIEYVGEDYPLLVDDYSDISAIKDADVLAAHNYLSNNKNLVTKLSYESFIYSFSEIYNEIKSAL